ncbi:nuclear transport factor 2 family protein [Desulfogranum mediterraneum]|uniref:nuclear transport factor 2 family protein n=1 Tax=Desulfogranum mediterraneum TaxID=160661 RepID=UPI0004295CED|nr:nuclear transport factor 2 family protein [Desulfogranum mediterraneum]
MNMTTETVRTIFSHLESGDADGFFAHVHPRVDWTVMGSHPLAGHYTSREEFRQKTFQRLTPCLTAPVRLSLEHLYLDGNTATVELRALSQAKAGWDFDNRYCWVVTFLDQEIVRVRAYLDSSMVARLIAEGEA